ncbi:transposase [Streptomyces cyaneofuscatus]|uniref:transposase n=1 Tax=Streptomyces cyaneofuscatus TaxID=66883 RepID=UPI00379EB0B3
MCKRTRRSRPSLVSGPPCPSESSTQLCTRRGLSTRRVDRRTPPVPRPSPTGAPTPSHPREWGADTGPSPVDRRRTGSKHHVICDGRGTPLKVITTAANVNDVTQTLASVDGIPPVAGRPGRPRCRPEALRGDKGYDSNPNRDALRERRILPVISHRGSPGTNGIGKLSYVVEQTFALLHHCKRLATRWERRTEPHVACSLNCYRRPRKAHS